MCICLFLLCLLLAGDEDVVNVIQPHPHQCMLVSSGIENDIKLWLPTADEIDRCEDVENIKEENKRRVTTDINTHLISLIITVLLFLLLCDIALVVMLFMF